MDKKFLPYLLILFTFIIYFNSLFNDFAYDDRYTIVNNTNLKNFKQGIPNFFSKDYFKISGTEQTYRPVTTLYYFIVYAFWKLNPLAYHLLSIILHTAVVLLIYFLFRKLTGNHILSFCVSILYLAHPALTETVNCPSYIEDILSALFFILSFIFYLKFKETDNKKNYLYAISLLFFLIALLSKEMAITLPAVIILYELFIGKKEPDKRPKKADFSAFIKEIFSRIKENIFYYSGFILTAVFYLFLLFVVFKNPDKSTLYSIGSLTKRAVYIPFSIFQFIRISIYPVSLNADYVFTYPASFFSTINIISYLIVLGILTFSFVIYRLFKLLSFGIWWFFITLTPVLNIIEIYKPLAERYLYLPLIGFCLAVGVILIETGERIKIEKNIKDTVKVVSVLALFLVYAFFTTKRNPVWKNDFTLFSDVIMKSPDSENANNNLGALYYLAGDLEKAESYYKKAVEINPSSDTYYINLGQLYVKKSLIDEAVIQFKKAIELNPSNYLSNYYLGQCLEKKKIYEDALVHYKKAVELNPGYINSYNRCANIYMILKKYNEAIELLEKALSLDPGNVNIKINLNRAREMIKR